MLILAFIIGIVAIAYGLAWVVHWMTVGPVMKQNQREAFLEESNPESPTITPTGKTTGRPMGNTNSG